MFLLRQSSAGTLVDSHLNLTLLTSGCASSGREGREDGDAEGARDGDVVPLWKFDEDCLWEPGEL